MATSETRERPHSPAKVARLARPEGENRLIDVATAAEISVSYLSMIERGYIAPLEVRVRIAAVLEVSENELWPA